MPITDPVMAVLDRLPLAGSQRGAAEPTSRERGGPAPFGLRFAVTPMMPCGKHNRTYYTVTVKEADRGQPGGKVVTIQDDVQKERED
ncbi:hypothetical protein [Actinokineospora sp.]|uniref:hypothetical protein n=1 Tax=Actinokineospora sp. TaxID=1872133 RepID=UPI0040384C3F